MSAFFSPCRTWRYSLTRTVQPVLTGTFEGEQWERLTFVGLNPSTADETVDDPTIRRCMRFAADWGFSQLKMLNLYAYRATKPADLWAARRDGIDIIGPENDQVLAVVFGGSDLVVAAWGVHAEPERVASVLRLVADPYCLGRTKNGAPRHPLYVRADTPPLRFAA